MLLLSVAHPVSCCSVLAMVLAQSLLPFLLIEVPCPNSGRVGLGGGISWKTVSKDLRAKSKDLPYWRKRKGALLSASVCKCLSKQQVPILGAAGGLVWVDTLHYPVIAVEWLTQLNDFMRKIIVRLLSWYINCSKMASTKHPWCNRGKNNQQHLYICPFYLNPWLWDFRYTASSANPGTHQTPLGTLYLFFWLLIMYPSPPNILMTGYF